MHKSEYLLREERWQRVFAHEISRRQKVMNEKPKAYAKIFRQNPKRLQERCKDQHCWVPATGLWIHDGGRASIKLYGAYRRSFIEAKPYSIDNMQYVPQMCWHCCCTRTLAIQKKTKGEWRESLAAHIKTDAKGKPRGRAGTEIMLNDLDDLYM